MTSHPHTKKSSPTRKAIIAICMAAVAVFLIIQLNNRFGVQFDDSGRIYFGLNAFGVYDDAEQLEAHFTNSAPPPPVMTRSVESIWQNDAGDKFYSRSTGGFTVEVICKVKNRDVFPKGTKYGVVVWTKHLKDDYWWLVLKN